MDEKDLEKFENLKNELLVLFEKQRAELTALKSDCRLCKANMQNEINELNATLYGRHNVKGLINKFDDFSNSIEAQIDKLQAIIYKGIGGLFASLTILNTVLFIIFK